MSKTPARHTELVWATTVGVGMLGLYWLTLAPGLLGLIDTPKLQFVGAVLGVPHPPGYPVYVWLSYLFSFLPVGSLAYRINLMSAVFASVTVALVFLCGRQAGANRFASAVGAIGLGSGQLFWSTAVVAEVYTLHTALLAGIILSLQRWAATRSSLAYYTAVACVAVSLGHHTTMALLGPAFAAYVVLVEPRYAFRASRLVGASCVLGLGLAPYLFIAVRTAQTATFVETPITSIADGLAAISGQRWQSALFAFDLGALLRERVPFVVNLLTREFSGPGLLVAGAGLAALLRRRDPLAALLGIAGLINLLFVLVYDIVEIAVFLLPTALTGWLCATVLVGQGVAKARRSGGPVFALVVVVLIGWTGWQLQRGYGPSDRSGEYQEIRRFDALFRALPPASVIVSNDYLVDSMLRYKLLGERVGYERAIRGPEPPDPQRLRRLHERGLEVFAFADSARALRLQGFRFAELLLTESVARHLRYVPDEAMVAIASPEGTAGVFARPRVDRIEAGGPPPSATSRMNGAIVGVAGAGGTALELWQPAPVEVGLAKGDPIGTTGVAAPTGVIVRSEPGVTSVRWEDQGLESSDALLVEWNPDGSERESHVVSRETRFAIEFDQREQGFGTTHIPDLRVYRLLDPGSCGQLNQEGFVDIHEWAREGKIAAGLTGSASMTIYVGRDAPLSPRLTYETEGAGVRLRTQRVTTTERARQDLRDVLGQAAGPDAVSPSTAPFLYRVVVDRMTADDSSAAATVVFGGVPDFAYAGLGGQRPIEGRVCSATLGYDGLFGRAGRRVERLDWTNAGHDELLGAGWTGRAPDRLRRAAATAELLLPLWRRGDLRVQVTASLPARASDATQTVGLEVNGTMLEPHQARSGWRDYSWTVPDQGLRLGLNQIYLHLSNGSAPEPPADMDGLHVREIALVAIPARLGEP